MTSMTINGDDGAFEAFVEYPNKLPAPVIVVIHEVFGVNNDMRASCAELAAQGFIAVCPDLFWRQTPGVDLNHWSDEEKAQAIALYEAFDLTLGVADIGIVMAAAAKMEGSNGKVGLMGYCLGGLLTYLTAAQHHPQAAVAYYGGGIDQHLDLAKAVGSPLLMHFGDDDEYLSAAAQAKIHAALDPQPSVEIHTYPGQGHAFARHTGERYNAEAAALAAARTLAFFRGNLS